VVLGGAKGPRTSKLLGRVELLPGQVSVWSRVGVLDLKRESSNGNQFLCLPNLLSLVSGRSLQAENSNKVGYTKAIAHRKDSFIIFRIGRDIRWRKKSSHLWRGGFGQRAKNDS
jgi:hypothetical protein